MTSLNFDSLPMLLTSNDLVAIGLYPTVDAAWVARLKGKSPDFIKLDRKILYPKQSVIDFIQQRLNKGDTSSPNSTE